VPAPRPIYGISADAIALVGATAKSVIEIRTPSSTGIVVVAWWVTFDGVTATNSPVKCEVGIFSASTGATTTSFTPTLINYGNRGLASQVTAFTNCNAEGAGTPTYEELFRVPPTSGMVWQESLGMEWTVGASSFWRMRLTAPQAVNATVGVRWTE
jgi:hypothetical protein